MAQNPLLGNRISLISRKSIRYEGTLYSINEADATVALAEVRSYGTEGREKFDPNAAYVPPQDVVHPYLLFRGCDIKDLHVHEREREDAAAVPPPPPDPAILSTQAPSDIRAKTAAAAMAAAKTPSKQAKPNSATIVDNPAKPKFSASASARNDKNQDGENRGDRDNSRSRASPPGIKQNGSNHHTYDSRYSKHDNNKRHQNAYRYQPRSNSNNRGGYTRRPRRNDTKIGTGASLLNRKARGAVVGEGPEPTPGDDFDFETSLAEFKEKTTIDTDDDYDDEAANAYSKDDFFDSISCDVLDKQNGIDNRLRGATERSLNMDTFGAVSLGNGRRGGRRKGRRPGGRGGYRNGNGGGRGGGRGEAVPPGPPGRENQRWRRPMGTGGNKNLTFSSGAHAAQYARAGGDR